MARRRYGAALRRAWGGSYYPAAAPGPPFPRWVVGLQVITGVLGLALGAVVLYATVRLFARGRGARLGGGGAIAVLVGAGLVYLAGFGLWFVAALNVAFANLDFGCGPPNSTWGDPVWICRLADYLGLYLLAYAVLGGGVLLGILGLGWLMWALRQSRAAVPDQVVS